MGRIFLGEMELTQQTVVSAITQEVNTVSGEVNTHVSNASTHLSQGDRTNIDSITGSVGTMAYENKNDYYTKSETSGKTEISTVLNGITELMEKSELVTSAALNDLNDNKLDVSAYTPTDLSNYYQKSETSGKTEISTALIGKSDTGHTHSQYLTGITSSQVTTALGYTPADNNHTHVASGITAMTGYEIASSGSSIATTDTLNQAVGKLEKMIDELKQFISDKEMTIAAALTDLDDRLKAIE
jgi:hypothetical protein